MKKDFQADSERNGNITMAKYQISYSVYPDSEKATAYSKRRAEQDFLLSVLAAFATIVVLLLYIYAVTKLCMELAFFTYLTSLIGILAISGIDLYVFVLREMITKRNCTAIVIHEKNLQGSASTLNQLKKTNCDKMKSAAILYYKAFFLLLVIGTALIGCVYAIYTLCHKNEGLPVLIVSITVLAAGIVAALLMFRFKPDSNLDQTTIDSIQFDRFSKITKVICYATLPVFLFLLFKMVPGFGGAKIGSYVIAAAITIGAAILFRKREPIAYQKKSRVFYTVSLVMALALLIGSAGLRVVYEAKVDKAEADIPNSGEILVAVSLDEYLYTTVGDGRIKAPKPSVIINDTLCKNGDAAIIPINKELNVRNISGGPSEDGYVDTVVTFTPDLLKGGYNMFETVPVTSQVNGKVTVTYRRVMDFWSVILY